MLEDTALSDTMVAARRRFAVALRDPTRRGHPDTVPLPFTPWRALVAGGALLAIGGATLAINRRRHAGAERRARRIRRAATGILAGLGAVAGYRAMSVGRS